MTAADPRPQERLLLDLVPELAAPRVLCNTSGRAQFAAAMARAAARGESREDATVTCWFLDMFQEQQSLLANQPLPGGLRLICEADPPAGENDLVAWCLSKQGETELARDLLQLGHERLALGGQMAVAIDNPQDQWLHQQLRGMFAKVTRRPLAAGVVYLARKTAALKKLKDYSSTFTFRDGTRVIELCTRPGVFSHRALDGGARALVKTIEVRPGERVLDLGCGSGAVAVAAALRAENVEVLAVDSNPRAIEAALWAAERNRAPRFSAALDCDGSAVAPAAFDLVAANPPYFSNFRIAELFLQIALKALRPGGRLLLVTKTPQWYADNLPPAFTEAFTQPAGNYVVLIAIKG